MTVTILTSPRSSKTESGCETYARFRFALSAVFTGPEVPVLFGEGQVFVHRADLVRLALLLLLDLCLVSVALLGANVLGLLEELLLQGVAFLDEAVVRISVELALPLVKSRLANGEILLTSGEAFLELLQASPLRPLFRFGEREFALAQRELPLGVRGSQEVFRHRCLPRCSDARGGILCRVPPLLLTSQAGLVDLEPRRREAPAFVLKRDALRHKTPT